MIKQFIPISKIDARMDAFNKNFNKAISDTIITNTELSEIAFNIAKVSNASTKKLTEEQKGALYQSIKHLEKKKCSVSVIKKNALRIIANWNFIEEGIPIPEWDGGCTTADLEFVGVYKPIDSNDLLDKIFIKTKLLSGIAAGMVATCALYTNAVYFFLDKYSWVGSYKFQPEEVAGMRAKAVVSMESDTLKIKEWVHTTSNKKHNNRLASYRTSNNKCSLQIECNECNKTVKQCSLAVWV